MTLFYTTLLCEKQDQISEAVLCCKEALRTRREVVHNARDHHDLFNLFTTSVGYMPRFVHRLKCKGSGRDRGVRQGALVL